jgi:Zn-finger nucleic acid-binding protein
MKCPRCESSVLDERERDGVTVDVCRECRGVWLDRSELERIVARAVREQAELEPPVPAQPPAGVAPPQAPVPQGYAPRPEYGAQPHGYPPPRYRDDDTPPHGYRHDHGHPYDPRRKKRHWFETLSDIFD